MERRADVPWKIGRHASKRSSARVRCLPGKLGIWTASFHFGESGTHSPVRFEQIQLNFSANQGDVRLLNHTRLFSFRATANQQALAIVGPDDAFELCAGEQEDGDFDVILDAVIQEAILFEDRTIDLGAVFV